jgi:hypothetical protein
MTKPVVYVLGYQEELSKPASQLLETLRSDPDLTVVGMEGLPFPGYEAVGERVRASDVLIFFAGDASLTALYMAVQMTAADARPIPVLVYPIVAQEEWPLFWRTYIGRVPSHVVLPAEQESALRMVRERVSAA